MTATKSERIRALLAQGLTPAAIAAAVGCRRQYVYVVRARAAAPDGLTASHRRWKAENRDEDLRKGRERARRRYAGRRSGAAP
jgi:hypothetical protein